MFSSQLIVRLISKKLEILATICWLCTTVRIKRIKNFNVQVTRLIACCCSKRCKQHFFEFDVCSACDHVEYLILSRFDSHFLLIWILSVLQLASTWLLSIIDCVLSMKTNKRQRFELDMIISNTTYFSSNSLMFQQRFKISSIEF